MPWSDPSKIPVWVYLVVTVVLPALGWVSRDWAERARSKVADTVSVRDTQQSLIETVTTRVADLEERLDAQARMHRREIESLQEAHQRQIQTLTEHYEQRVSLLQSHVDRVERQLRMYQDPGTPGT